MITISVRHENGSGISKFLDSDEDNVTWPELCTEFFEVLLGLGYMLPDSPENMTNALEELREEE